MASYTESAALGNDPLFVSKIEVAIVERAILVTQESDLTVNHTARAAFAHKVVNDPYVWSRIMVWGVVSETTITANSSDATIASQISGMWDAYS